MSWNHLVALALFSSTPGFAQSSSPDFDVVEPSRIQAAREMAVASRVVTNTRAGAAIGFQSSFDAVVSRGPLANDAEAIEAIRKAGLEEMNLALNDVMPQFIDRVALAYAKKFTVDEMRSATAFYQSATGQKLLDNVPAMITESAGVMQTLLDPYLPKIQQRAINALTTLIANRKSTQKDSQ
jgi:uncharacterized protein